MDRPTINVSHPEPLWRSLLRLVGWALIVGGWLFITCCAADPRLIGGF